MRRMFSEKQIEKMIEELIAQNQPKMRYFLSGGFDTTDEETYVITPQLLPQDALDLEETWFYTTEGKHCYINFVDSVLKDQNDVEISLDSGTINLEDIITGELIAYFEV